MVAMDGVLLDISTLDPVTKWLLIVAVGLTIFYAVMRPMRKKKDPLSRQPVPASLAGQRAVERDMNNLLVELSEMARQITAQLDTRTLKLEMLIKEADDRLAALKAAITAPPIAIAPAPEKNQNIAPPVPIDPPVDPRHLEVYHLTDQGRSAQEIAQRLSRPQGEVELILALRDRATAV
jgi:hypothetical protein